MLAHFPILTFLIWFPVLGAVAVLMTGGDQHAGLARKFATIISMINLGMCIPLYMLFDPSSYAMQFVQDHLWIRVYKIHYAVGVDGISLAMIILTNFTGLLVIFAGCEAI